MASLQLWSRNPLEIRLATSRLPGWRPVRPLASSSDGPNPTVSDGSYLSMWKRAKDRHELEQLRLHKDEEEKEPEAQPQDIQRRALEEQTQRFSSLLQVPSEERDRVQRMQVVDRAAAALAAANALLAEQSSFRNTAATLPPAYAQAVSEYRGKTSLSATGCDFHTVFVKVFFYAAPGNVVAERVAAISSEKASTLMNFILGVQVVTH